MPASTCSRWMSRIQDRLLRDLNRLSGHAERRIRFVDRGDFAADIAVEDDLVGDHRPARCAAAMRRDDVAVAQF